MREIVDIKLRLGLVSLIVLAGAMISISCYVNPAMEQKLVEPGPAPIVQTVPVIPKYTVKGVTYHDYNGDGIHQENEPVVPGISLQLSTTANAMTDDKGEYSLKLDPGKYIFRIENVGSVIGYNDQPFKCVSISKEDFRMVGEYSRAIDLENDLTYDIGLIQGFLTLPFRPDAKFLISDYLGIGQYQDIDNRWGYKLDWTGNQKTTDGHSGTDFVYEENTPILAAAPGIVAENPTVAHINQGDPVFIQHDQIDDYLKTQGFVTIGTFYAHLNKALVKPGERVNRGDVIGLSGHSFGSIPHLHFTVLIFTKPPYMKDSYNTFYLDPYRAENGRSPGLWTIDNDPQYP